MAHAHPTPPPAASLGGQVGLAAILAWTAGFVDAFGYLFLARVFTAHMSGNSASVGLFLSLHNWREVAWHAWPIAMFVAALLGGAAIMEGGRRLRRSGLNILLVVEMALIAGLLAVARNAHSGALLGGRGPLRWGIVALPALAMGLQTIAVTRVGELSVSTTYVTGTMNTFSEAMVQFLYSLFRPQLSDRLAGRRQFRHALVAAALWVSFFAGAISAAAAKSAWGAAALAGPLAALAVVLWRSVQTS